jgi:hypothetical protein
MSWYNQGYSGLAKEQERLEDLQGPQRLYIPAEGQKEIVFVDDEPFCIYEHNPKIGSSFRNWMTCLQGAKDDVVCCKVLGPNSRYYCGYLTVVDCTRWQDKKGNWHQYELRLLQAKMRTLKKFERKRADKGTLVGSLFKVTREDDKSPTCGDDFDFQKQGDLDKLFEVCSYRGEKLTALWDEAEEKPEVMARIKKTFQIEASSDGKLPRTVPQFNYLHVLKPKSPSELKLLLSSADVSGSNGSSGRQQQAVVSEDVPF